MNSTQVIGLSGVAGSGKDLFYSLCETLPCARSLWPVKKFSIAESLKDECFSFICDNYGININNCSWEEKDAVRKILVAHGEIKRDLSKGTHWFEKITEEVIKSKETHKTIFITDIRFDEYEYDEVKWLRETLEGSLVHISKIKINPQGEMEYHPPANPTETRNDPKLIKGSDYEIEWEDVSSLYKDTPWTIDQNVQEKQKKLSIAIDNFAKWVHNDSRRDKLAGRKKKKTYLWLK